MFDYESPVIEILEMETEQVFAESFDPKEIDPWS